MSLRIGELFDIAYDYVKAKVNKAMTGFNDAPDPVKKYKLTAEPPSALFTYGAKVKVIGVEDARNPLEAQVISEVTGIWRPETVDLMRKLKAAKIDVRKYIRSGGVYQSTEANKKLRKQHKYFNFLVEVALSFWRCVEWEEDAKPRTIRLLQDYDERDARNLEMLSMDSSSLTVGKPEKTGTGYLYPFDTRIALQQNFAKAKVMLKDTCHTFMTDLIEAVKVWPSKGAVITIGGAWKGVKGSRADADVIVWDGDGDKHQVIKTMTRDVGTVPNSTLHNKALDPTSWQTEMWTRHRTPYHILPMDIEGPARSLTTPPATMPGDDMEEMVIISSDFGATASPMQWDGQRVIVPNEKIALGADNITLFGINLHSIVANEQFGMLVSGAPFTMIVYLTMVGWVIGSWAQRQNISTSDLRIWQIGDDLQIMIRRKHIGALLGRFGPWLRGKGMDVTEAGHSYFVTGTYVVWKSRDHIVAFKTPRIIKSVTSASQTRDSSIVPQTVNVGDEFDMPINDEELDKMIAQYWERYGWTIFFEGTPQEYYNLWISQGEEAMAELAEVDPGSHFADMFAEQKQAGQRLRDGMDVPAVGATQKDQSETTPEAAARQDQSYPRTSADDTGRDPGTEGTSDINEGMTPKIEDVKVVPAVSETGEVEAAGRLVTPDTSSVLGPILISGPSGVGKSTLTDFIGRDKAIDLDFFGQRESADGYDHQVWVVRTDLIKYDMEQGKHQVYLGTSRNIVEPITTYSTGEAGVRREKTREPIAELNWGRKIWLWYEPSDEEMEFRFSPARANSYGKDPKTRAHLIADLQKQKGRAPPGFESFNITGLRTPEAVLQHIGLQGFIRR